MDLSGGVDRDVNEFANVEFLAENELVTIIPQFTYAPSDSDSNSPVEFDLIGGMCGPFRSGDPATAPLWLATHLKESRLCRIVTPDWLSLDALEAWKRAELETAQFCALPSPHAFNVTQLLLEVAPDDVAHGDEVKTLIKDIFDNRECKLRTSILAFIEKHEYYAGVDNLSMYEMARFRPYLTGALDQLHELYQLQASNSRRDQSTNASNSSLLGTTTDRSVLSGNSQTTDSSTTAGRSGLLSSY